MSGIITLTTDFGYRDPYVGTMKGVILNIHPGVTIVDLTHGISPHSVLEACFVIRNTSSFFPEGTLHVCVVDPGVGGSRRILYVERGGHRFLAPDNGILTGIVDSARTIRAIDNRDLFLEKVSATFHGRDIFSPLAARICAGIEPEKIGPIINDPVLLEWPEPDVGRESVEGTVIYVDVFGNLVSNIAEAHVLPFLPGGRVFLKGDEIGTPRKSYEEIEKGTPLAIINSFGLLEIAVREDSAARRFNAGTGDEVVITDGNQLILKSS